MIKHTIKDIQSPLANLRTLCQQQKCVAKREVADW